MDQPLILQPRKGALPAQLFGFDSPVPEVRLYGSRAKGNFRTGSDIDLSIMDEQVTSEQLLQMENDFDELASLYSIDLSLLHQIDNPALTEHILRIGKVFYNANRSA